MFPRDVSYRTRRSSKIYGLFADLAPGALTKSIPYAHLQRAYIPQLLGMKSTI